MSSRSRIKQSEVTQNGWLRSLLTTAIMFGVFRTVFAGAYYIPSGSMKNTLLVGDRVFVNKIGCYFETPKYVPFTTIELPHLHLKTWGVHAGDVVVFEYPGNRDEVIPREKDVNYVKRCVAEAGDVLQIVNKQVFVNGKVQHYADDVIYQSDFARSGWIDPRIFPKSAPWNKDNYGPLHVPKAGDQIALSASNIDQWQVFIEREGHSVKLASDQIVIDGKPTSTYKVQHNYLYMMGDNRDDSEDSRFWGFVPESNVVGTASVVYASWYNPGAAGDQGYDPDEAQTFHVRWDRIGKLVH